MPPVTPGGFSVYVDGASRGNPGPAAIGVIIKDEQGATLLRVSSYIGTRTNNQAEYTALITALKEAQRLGAARLAIKTDSQLMAEQLAGRYRVRNENIRPLFEQAVELFKSFRGGCTLKYIPRELNAEADRLANQALDGLEKP